MNISIWSIGLLLGIIAVVIVIPFLLRTGQKPATLLGCLTLILMLVLVNYLIVDTSLYQITPWAVGLAQPLLFLVGPLYYFYGQSLVQPNFKLRKQHAWHLLPFLMACYYHSRFILLSSEQKVQVLNYFESQVFISPTRDIAAYIFIHSVLCLAYGLKMKKVWQGNEAASAPNDFFQWTKKLNVVYTSFWILCIVWAIYLLFAGRYYHEADYVVMLIMSVVISLPAFALIYHHEGFKRFLLEVYQQKYQKSSLSIEQATALSKKLLLIMENKKPYLESALRISDLALSLNISTNLLSQVINQQLNKNFTEFINEYRIAEALSRLQDPKYAHLTILGVAMEVGFSNKNTFNRLFKQQTGITPSQFLRSHSS